MAKRFFSAEAFFVFEIDVDVWDYPRHRHNFFELVFIISGSGTHFINDAVVEYEEGQIFLLTPQDEHHFVVADRTKFGYLKFTEQIFLEKSELVSDLKWKKQIESVILHANSLGENILTRPEDRQSVFELFGMIKREFENPATYGRSVLLELFGALLIIISRNVSSLNTTTALTEKDRVNEILTYIRQHVLDSEKTSIATIAEEFLISPNYVSVFIKKHAGISIQQYTIQTKIKMAERLLKQTALNISEISQKMGFVDSSHFTKTFKKHKGVSPKEYRQQ